MRAGGVLIRPSECKASINGCLGWMSSVAGSVVICYHHIRQVLELARPNDTNTNIKIRATYNGQTDTFHSTVTAIVCIFG